MMSNIKIRLQIPRNPNRHFSLFLKKEKMNEQSVYKMPHRIFAVSDIEGNFSAFCKLLRMAGVIDKYLKWTFNENHLVIVGDCFDRGDEVLECLWLIYSLEQKAEKFGGHVHFILGNHEIMNMNGDWRYVHPKYASTKSAALYDGSNEIWRWLRTKNIIEQIGETLFVHGGISKELLDLQLTIDQINDLARPYDTDKHTINSQALQVIFSTHSSPFWYRGYYRDPTDENTVDETLLRYGVQTIVTGHTTIEQISSFFNGKVINLNTDHSLESSQGLMISGGKFYRIDTTGKKETIK